jgi:LPS export ABC transporter protein LptC
MSLLIDVADFETLARRAQNRAILARILGYALVLACGGGLAAVLVQTGLFQQLLSPGERRIELKDLTIVTTARDTKVTGIDKSRQPYEVTAKTAYQDQDNQRLLHLEMVAGKFTRSNDDRIDVTSNLAAFNTRTNHLVLEGKVVMRGSDASVITMDKAAVDINAGRMESQSAVHVVSGSSVITADHLQVDNNGETFKFTGRVKASIGGGN